MVLKIQKMDDNLFSGDGYKMKIYRDGMLYVIKLKTSILIMVFLIR
jgi:hypothetical protein